MCESEPEEFVIVSTFRHALVPTIFGLLDLAQLFWKISTVGVLSSLYKGNTKLYLHRKAMENNRNVF